MCIRDRYIKKAEVASEPGQIITGASFGLVFAAQKERLLFLRLRLVHAAVQKKSLVETMQAAHDAAHPKGLSLIHIFIPVEPVIMLSLIHI